MVNWGEGGGNGGPDVYFVVLRPREVRELGLARAAERELLREVLRRMGWRTHAVCAALGACGLVQFLVLAMRSGEGLPVAVRVVPAVGGVVGFGHSPRAPVIPNWRRASWRSLMNRLHEKRSCGGSVLPRRCRASGRD